MHSQSLFRAAALAAPLFAGSWACAVPTVFVNDNFDSYADQGAFEAVWPARSGDGFTAPPVPGGTLVDQPTGVAGQTGNAVSGPEGAINEHFQGWHPTLNPTGYQIVPSATQEVVVRGDIFATASLGSLRQSIGLRSDILDRNPDPAITEFGLNFIELGFWNADVCLPTNPTCSPGDVANGIPADPEFRASSDFGFRAVLLDSSSIGDYKENGVAIPGTPIQSPNWQYFPLDPLLDAGTITLPNGSTGNANGLVDIADIGDGWHTYSATITPTTMTFTLDLFRDGLNNATGLAGVDSTVEVTIALAENFNNPPFKFDPAPLNSLRIGAPSGVSSANALASFDNLYLALEDIDVPSSLDGDYNDDGIVDAADYTVWRDNLGQSVTLPGDTTPGTVVQADYDVWKNNFGATGALGAIGAGVPEPSSIALVAAAGIALVARRSCVPRRNQR